MYWSSSVVMCWSDWLWLTQHVAVVYHMQALELRSVLTYKSHVLVAHTEAFSGVTTDDFLQALAG